jgi:hypothetical protein
MLSLLVAIFGQSNGVRDRAINMRIKCVLLLFSFFLDLRLIGHVNVKNEQYQLTLQVCL